MCQTRAIANTGDQQLVMPNGKKTSPTLFTSGVLPIIIIYLFILSEDCEFEHLKCVSLSVFQCNSR